MGVDDLDFKLVQVFLGAGVALGGGAEEGAAVGVVGHPCVDLAFADGEDLLHPFHVPPFGEGAGTEFGLGHPFGAILNSDAKSLCFFQEYWFKKVLGKIA
jgi:hypothetical protein